MNLAIGSTQTVLYPDAVYDTYNNWTHIDKVPKFKLGAVPEEGKEYTITFSGLHACGLVLYVLDEQFIVHSEAFLAPEFHVSQAELLAMHLQF